MAEATAFTDLMHRRGFWCPVHNVRILPNGCDAQCSRPVAERGAPTCGYGCKARLDQGLQPPKSGEEARGAETPAQEPETGAWPLIRERAGVASQSGLGKKLGCTQGGVQSFLNQLRKGNAPGGGLAEALLKLTGLTMRELLAAEGHARPAEPKKPGQPEQPGQLAQSLGAVLGIDPGQELREAAPADEDHAPPMAAPAAVSPDAEAAAPPPVVAPAPAQPSGPAAADPAGPEGHPAAASGAPDLPEEFEPYTPRPGRRQGPGEAMLSVARDGDLSISSAAVSAFGLETATHVRLFWSSRSTSIGIMPLTAPTDDSLSLGRKKHCDMRQVSAAGFLKRFNIRAVCARYPITRGPGGLLVAKINLEEAA